MSGTHWPETEDEVTLTFAYGTLRPGYGNDWVWRHQGQGWPEQAVLRGWKLTGADYGFPYAVPAEGEVAYGTIIEPAPGRARYVRETMDGLEGYPHHYDRVVVTVEVGLTGRTVQAWVYFPRDARRALLLRQVPGNDWANVGRRVAEDWALQDGEDWEGVEDDGPEHDWDVVRTYTPDEWEASHG